MRAKEFIIEDGTIPDSDNRLSSSVARSLPATYSIPALPNNDFYKQYRFGVAIASARGAEERQSDFNYASMSPSSAWGENEIIIAYDLDTEIIDDALNIVGLKSSDKKLISTKKSEEMSEVDTNSPVQGFKGYPR